MQILGLALFNRKEGRGKPCPPSEEDSIQLTGVVVKPQGGFSRSVPFYECYERLKTSNSPLSSPKLGQRRKNVLHFRQITQSIVRKTSSALNSQRKLQEHETSDWIIYQAAVDRIVQELKNHVGALELKGLDVKHALSNALDSDGISPLHLASRFNHEKLAVFLLANGAQADATGNDGTVPLHIAIRYAPESFLIVFYKERSFSFLALIGRYNLC